MTATVFDSPLYAHLFPTGEVGRLFSDSAAIRAMLLVEGALAKAQGALGFVPEISAAAIQRASLEAAIDPGALAQATGQNGVSVPGLVDAFRAEMKAPEHAQFIHWGATSQDIMDTGLMLRLRQALALIEADLRGLVAALAKQAEQHASSPMVARTYGQIATPTSWGAVLAQWGHPLIDAIEVLPDVRARSLWVSLSGAAGTASALGDQAPALRAMVAESLGLIDPGRSWHTDRGPILRIADWLAGVNATLGGMGSTTGALAASGVEEMRFDRAGGSSTMPQKQNPVAASALVALAHQASGLRSVMASAAQHQHQRDGAAWFTEWMAVPQIVLGAAAASRIALELARDLAPDTARMHETLTGGPGLMQAEALSFALSDAMPRAEAQATVKALCARALAEGRPLSDLAREAHPDLHEAAFDPLAQMGQAPADAWRFVERAKSM